MTAQQSVQIMWEDAEQTCVRLTLHQMPSYQVVSDAFTNAQACVRSVLYPVDLLIVVKSDNIPTGFIHAVKQAEEHTPQNVNRIAMVGGRQLTFKMIREFMMSYRPSERLQQRFFFCETEDEARALLARNPQHLSSE